LRRSVDAESISAPPTWPSDPADVEALVTLAGHHFVTPALALALRGNTTVPGDVGEYLEAALYLSRDRNERLLGALETAARVLVAHGIAAVLLKGAANLADGLYPDPAMRIELHRAVMEAPYGRLLDPERVRRSALPLLFRGQPLALPTPTHRVLHNIVHDQLVDGAYGRRTASLRQLLDLSLLCRRYDASIDWDELEASFAARQARVLRYDLGLARLFGASPPIGSLPLSLRRLRTGVEKPRSFVRLRLRRKILRVVHRPAVMINLLVPATWPERTKQWTAMARRPRA
jgi:hypothetical protein